MEKDLGAKIQKFLMLLPNQLSHSQQRNGESHRTFV